MNFSDYIDLTKKYDDHYLLDYPYIVINKNYDGVYPIDLGFKFYIESNSINNDKYLEIRNIYYFQLKNAVKNIMRNDFELIYENDNNLFYKSRYSFLEKAKKYDQELQELRPICNIFNKYIMH